MKSENFNIGNNTWLLGLQMLVVCFGATILVPLLTGISTSIVLFTAGISTLIMHYFGRGEYGAPIIFLGSSFAYIAPIIYIQDRWDMPSVFFALGVAGIMKVLFSFVIKKTGSDFISEKLFPPVISGTMIMLIGLTLIDTGIDMASGNWLLAIITLSTAGYFMMFTEGITRLYSVLIAILTGYISALLLGEVTFVSLPLVSMPEFTLPRFNLSAAIYILPFALAPTIEHFGDVFAVSEATGNKYYKSPGMHRTMLIDGIGTMLSFVGSVPNTTYSEGTSAVSLLKIRDPKVTRNAGIFAIIFSFVGVLAAFLQSIPTAVVGGVMIILFGNIATLGFKTFVSNKVDFTSPKNTFIASTMIVFGLSGITVYKFSGVGLAALIGIGIQVSFLIKEKYKK